MISDAISNEWTKGTSLIDGVESAHQGHWEGPLRRPERPFEWDRSLCASVIVGGKTEEQRLKRQPQ